MTGENMLNDVLQAITGRRLLLLDAERSKIFSAAERYLDSLPFTLFADWDISHVDRKALAAEWLTDQVMHVLDEMGGNHE
jgi:hypothetical protein